MVTKKRVAKRKIEMVPRDYFDDKVTLGTARGTLRHLRYNRFTLVNLHVGYGKTLIAVLTAVGIAKMHGGEAQIGVIAPKAKRLDHSFGDAIKSAEKYFDVKLTPLLINGEETGTFSGLSIVGSDPAKFRALERAVIAKPTMFILDETHMTLRDSTNSASKVFVKLLNHVEKAGGYAKVVGLTATPFDKSILDAIGYLVFNGNYNSRSEFYRKEVAGYAEAQRKGMTQKDIEALIIRRNFTINKQMFYDIHRIVNQLKGIIYSPRAPKDFHIPENKIVEVPIQLTEERTNMLKHLRELDRDGAFPDPTTKRLSYIDAMTTDKNMVEALLKIVQHKNIKQPLVFYQFNTQRDVMTESLSNSAITYVEVNGKSHSYFDATTTEIMPVIVQYGSGATAFEAKKSNCSVYFGLPDSSINFDQSLGRNARRGQQMDVIINYILVPLDKSGKPVQQFKVQWTRIKNKMIQNARFLEAFKTDWGTYEKPSTEKAS